MTQNRRVRLDSWKAVADYLKRDQRTVQRWEREKGLPVHRVPGGLRNAVFAYTDEIDAWLEGHPAVVTETAPAAAPLRKFRLGAAVSVAVLLVAALAVVVVLVNSRRPPTPARITFAGADLLVWDARGNLLWEYELPFPVREHSTIEAAHWTLLTDMDGDGRREVIVAPEFGRPKAVESSDTVFCFSSTGNLLWKYRADFKVNMGGREYAGPWEVSDLEVFGDPGAKRLWVSFVHQTWSPSVVVRIDQRGQGELRFFNSGWITYLRAANQGEPRFMLAGGVNDEYGAAAMAVLDADAPPASSPQSAARYQCADCPAEGPARYFVFPRSELNLLEKAASHLVRQLIVSPARIEVRIEELPTPSGANADSIFEFSQAFELTRVAANQAYWSRHRELEDLGRIPHSTEKCRTARGAMTVRMWVAGNGWSELSADDDVPESIASTIRPRPSPE